ncbi:hypothetical protein [Streptomyces radiopugnans]|uniref:Heparin binding hemagglutinin HbhA n=1 Tax=Streptomyces radiopugnans TaxID=403935 RepID=A0A1H9EB42_9ACTN|nr:hypothetical protein [Streptomyces radiopugnans]SEQ22839.1 hypothetical protein SAMN05216481_10522 [Streptomyces radiopugnans]
MPEKTAGEAANKTGDLRKALTDPTPLYFAAGVIDKIRRTAPERLAAVKDRTADPKAVQERLAQQAKETQSRLTNALSGFDADLKKLREQAQHLALQGVGLAAEYAVKAREGYGELAERGRGAVETWRGEKNAGENGERNGAGVARGLPVKGGRGGGEAVTVEAGGKEEKPRPKMGDTRRATPGRASASKTSAPRAGASKTTARRSAASETGAAKKAAAEETPKTVAKKAAARKSAAKKTAAKRSASPKASSPSDKLPTDNSQE